MRASRPTRRERALAREPVEGPARPTATPEKQGTMADTRPTRPTRLGIAVMLGILGLAIGAAVWFAPQSNWDLPLFAILLVFSVFSYVTAVTTESNVKISGAFLALVLAMVFLGGTAAAAIGVATNLIGWLFRWRDEPHYLLNNLVAYAIFPLVAGVAFHAVVDATGVTDSEPVFYLLVFALFQFALALNFLLIAAYHVYVGRATFSEQVRVLP